MNLNPTVERNLKHYAEVKRSLVISGKSVENTPRPPKVVKQTRYFLHDTFDITDEIMRDKTPFGYRDGFFEIKVVEIETLEY